MGETKRGTHEKGAKKRMINGRRLMKWERKITGEKELVEHARETGPITRKYSLNLSSSFASHSIIHLLPLPFLLHSFPLLTFIPFIFHLFLPICLYFSCSSTFFSLFPFFNLTLFIHPSLFLFFLAIFFIFPFLFHLFLPIYLYI